MPDTKIDIAELTAMARVKYENMSPVERALHDADQKRSFVRGQAGHDPGPDVLAEEVRRLRVALEQSQREVERLKESHNTTGAAEREVGQFVYRRIEALMDATAGTPEADELSYLAEIVSDVEEYGATGAEAHQRGPFTTAHEAAAPLVLYPDDGVEYGGRFSTEHQASQARVAELTAEVEMRELDIQAYRASEGALAEDLENERTAYRDYQARVARLLATKEAEALTDDDYEALDDLPKMRPVHETGHITWRFTPAVQSFLVTLVRQALQEGE